MSITPNDNFSCTLPWRTDNRFRLLVDGDQFYPRIIQCISAAHSAVDLEMYLFESGSITDDLIQTLINARQRDVYVRLLLDHVGSRSLRQADRDRLTDAGVDLRFFNKVTRKKRLRNLSRDHRKLILVDCAVAFVGGAGVCDEFAPQYSGPLAWHDALVEIEGPLVHDWQMMFERSWQHFESVHNEEIRAKIRNAFDNEKSPPLLNRNMPQARVVASRGLGNKPIIASLISELNKSQSQAWVCTAYFYPSRKLLKALRNAASRGVDVRLILPGSNTDHPGVRYASRTFYRRLLENGVRIFEYQPRFLHLKTAIVDNWLTIGSCNFDRWNLHWNLEANLEALESPLLNEINTLLKRDLEQCREIDLQQWKVRSWGEKIRERFWKWIALHLARLRND